MGLDDLASSEGVELAVTEMMGVGMASARPPLVVVTSITEITDSWLRVDGDRIDLRSAAAAAAAGHTGDLSLSLACRFESPCACTSEEIQKIIDQ